MADVLRFDRAESQRRRNKSKQAAEGRKRLAAWIDAAHDLRRAGKLIDFDLLLAEALTNFPSSTLNGYLWAAQATLGGKINKSVSTIERSVGRIKRAGLLHVKQRGNGRSAIYTFCINNEPILQAAAPASVRGLAPSNLKGLMGSAPASLREESCNLTESNKHESPPNPPAVPASAAPSDGRPKEWGRDRGGAALDGEVMPPEGEIDFDTFWGAIKGDRGPAGPASAQWRKLSVDDRRRIANLIGPSGIHIDGMWATTWLADRRFEHAPLRTKTTEPLDIVRWRIIYAMPGDPAFEAEYQRRVEAGEPTFDMDWARKMKRSFGMRVYATDDQARGR